MRKHFIGFVLFTAIVGTVAVGVWFLNVESNLPTASEPFPESFPQNSFDKSVTYRVESVVFDLDSGKLISPIQLNWNGTGNRPNALWVSASIADERKKTSTWFGSEVIADPFKNGAQVVVTSKTPGGVVPKLDGTENYYALFSVSADRSITSFSDNAASPKMPVLFVHGEGSKIAR